jgi:spermidine/putrescine transport system permease protein
MKSLLFARKWFTVGKALTIYAVAFFVVLYLPIAIIALFSFNDSRLLAQWRGFSVQWWQQLPGEAEAWEALANTVLAALSTALLSVTLAIFAGYALAKHRFRGRSIVDAMIFIPIAIPEVPEAASLFLFLGERRFDLGLLAVIIGHASFAVAFAVLVIRSRLARFDFSLEDAAQSLGATPVQSFRRITLPLSFPALLAAGLLSFLLSFDDFYVTFFVAPPGVDMLPVLIYSMAQRQGLPPLVNAIAVVMLAVSIPLSFVAGRYIGLREEPRTDEREVDGA